MSACASNRNPWCSRAVATVAVVTGFAFGSMQVADAATASCPSSRYRSARTRIIAHASGNWFGPANTVEMLRAAKAAGADIVDIDVRVTKDGQLVASHDDVVKVGSTQRSISRSTLAELRSLDLGDGWAGPKKDFPLRAGTVRIPTVSEVLAAFPTTLISMEFKVTGGERALCTLLRSNKRTGGVYIGSAGDAAVDAFAPLCPEVTTTVTDAMVPVMRAARQ
jgi:glycerophosphoryl diester phosphodiesterase